MIGIEFLKPFIHCFEFFSSLKQAVEHSRNRQTIIHCVLVLGIY